jgi:hypothetical protein
MKSPLLIQEGCPKGGVADAAYTITIPGPLLIQEGCPKGGVVRPLIPEIEPLPALSRVPGFSQAIDTQVHCQEPDP